MVKPEFKQGETTMAQGYCPDIRNKRRIIVEYFSTKHGTETKEQ